MWWDVRSRKAEIEFGKVHGMMLQTPLEILNYSCRILVAIPSMGLYKRRPGELHSVDSHYR